MKEKDQESRPHLAERIGFALKRMDEDNEKRRRRENNYKLLYYIIVLALTLETCFIGFLFLFKYPDHKTIIDLIKSMTLQDVLVVSIIIFGFILTITGYIYSTDKYSSNFSDIDRLRPLNKEEYKYISKENSTIEGHQTNHLVDESVKYESFHLYFNSIIASLNEQIKMADKKASLLLDKGTSYSRNGIYLYVFIIIAWQVITWITDLQTRHIYGIASCSLLFIFIEFLSAWFLKQYRHFVDTSTYLIKLRSTLERYILTYLALKEAKTNGGNFDPLIDLLKSEIKWPEMAQKGMQDVSAPKELIDSLSNLCSTFKKSN